jgi:hypothetical protein
MSCTARITGTDGWITLPAFAHRPDSLTVTSASDLAEERIDTAFGGDGLRFQVHEVHRCLTAGLRESPTMPLDETIALATTLDAIRAQIGLVYPAE